MQNFLLPFGLLVWLWNKFRVFLLFMCQILRKYIMNFLFAGHPIMIVTEYMANGSLDTFLRVRYCRLSKTYR